MNRNGCHSPGGSTPQEDVLACLLIAAGIEDEPFVVEVDVDPFTAAGAADDDVGWRRIFEEEEEEEEV